MRIRGVGAKPIRSPTRWPWRFTSTADETMRSEWMKQVTWLLGQLPPDAVEQQWQRWMRTYWRDRMASVPTRLTRAEPMPWSGGRCTCTSRSRSGRP